MNLTREQIMSMSAGRELDGLIDHHIFGNVWGYDCPKYSTDIAAAWEVVERLKVIEKESSRNRPIYVTEVGGYDNPVCVWRCSLRAIVNGIGVDAPTVPEAICKASLLTLIKEENQ